MSDALGRDAGRFAPEIGKRLGEMYGELHDFERRARHLRETLEVLTEVTRKKSFQIQSFPMWDMLLALRDKLMIDAASWAKALYARGGPIRVIQARCAKALSKLDDTWEPQISMVRPANETDAGVEFTKGMLRKELLARTNEWRAIAFDRLFPGAATAGRTTPNGQDFDELVDRLCTTFAPLLTDRHEHRAHVFEQKGKPTTLAPLALDDLDRYLAECFQILSDLECLGRSTHLADPRYRGKRQAREAEDVADLILFGPLAWYLDHTLAPIPGANYRVRRDELIVRLHARHDAHPEKCFNDHTLGEVEG